MNSPNKRCGCGLHYKSQTEPHECVKEGCHSATPTKITDWREDLHDPHSNIRVLMHSELGFPSKTETAGTMASKVIEHIEPFIVDLLNSAADVIGEKKGVTRDMDTTMYNRGLQHAIEVLRAMAKDNNI